MPQEQVTIHTRDGECPTYVLTPEGAGPWPAVIVYMDGFGIRPGLIGMAQHVADQGYLVLLPDLFYRAGPYTPLVPREVFAGDVRAAIGPLMSTTDNLKVADETTAFIAYLDSRSDVAGDRIGVTGFCMGGGMALTAAGKFPDRIKAVASFHGGNLVTDAPTSPHLAVPGIKAEVYVAGADKDHSYPLEMAEKLEKVLTDAGVKHRCVIYPGAAHGWMKPDFPIYDAAAAERGWKEFFALLNRNIG